jgi:hypothetical protein
LARCPSTASDSAVKVGGGRSFSDFLILDRRIFLVAASVAFTLTAAAFDDILLCLSGCTAKVVNISSNLEVLGMINDSPIASSESARIIVLMVILELKGGIRRRYLDEI